MIISPHIRELFGKHSDIMLPLLAEDPVAVAAFTDIVMGGDPEAISRDLCPDSSDLAFWAAFAVTMACISTSEKLNQTPSADRPGWEREAIKAIDKVLKCYDHLPAHP